MAVDNAKLKRFIRKLESARGRHTELVSVYIPAGYDMNRIITSLAQEQGTAENIKDKNTRQNVIDSLERMIRHLRLFNKTPENGLAVFSGNASEREDKVDIQVWSVEPPIPLKIRLYRCAQTFVTEPLKEMMETKECYGLVTVERQEASIGLLKGSYIQVLTVMTSGIPGKTRAGGQCIFPETMVQIADGNIIKINDTHNPTAMKSVDFKSGNLLDSPITDKWNVTKDESYTVITKHPRLEVSSSADHTFFVYDKGIKEVLAKNLKEGDVLLMPEKINVKGEIQRLNNSFHNSYILSGTARDLLKRKRIEKGLFQRQLAKKMNITQTAISVIEKGKSNASLELLKKLCAHIDVDCESLIANHAKPNSEVILPIALDEIYAQILGYLIGDGSIEKERVSFYESDPDVASNYEKIISNYFKCNFHSRFRKNKNYFETRFYGKPIVEQILSEFSEVKLKVIPKKVLLSKNEILASFLKGLFDAEGYVSGKLAIGMNNKELMQQVQMALLRFGIIASILEYDNNRNPYSDRHRFTLETSEKESLVAFKKLIGFTSARKNNLLNKMIDKKTDRGYVRQILADGSNVKSVLVNHNVKLDGLASSGFLNDKRKMSKSIFRKNIIGKIDPKVAKMLEHFINMPLLPVQINKIIRKSEKAKMVDISVRNQSFIANGIIVHNSAPRFARIREGMTIEFFKRIADAMNQEFLPLGNNLKGIIVGGPGPTKENMVSGNYINQQLKDKIIGIKDLCYSGEEGLREMVDRSEDLLAQEVITREKNLMRKFLEILSTNPGRVAYGIVNVENALNMGAVDTLLISEDLNDAEAERLEDLGIKFGAKVETISLGTMEGMQLRDLGKIAAILRFSIT